MYYFIFIKIAKQLCELRRSGALHNQPLGWKALLQGNMTDRKLMIECSTKLP